MVSRSRQTSPELSGLPSLTSTTSSPPAGQVGQRVHQAADRGGAAIDRDDDGQAGPASALPVAW